MMNNENQTKERSRKPQVDITTNEFLKLPFKYGWKRELVIRNNMANKNSDVYYISPYNKKLRSLKVIQKHVEYPLTIDNFSMERRPIFMYNTQKEVIRYARSKNEKLTRSKFFKRFPDSAPQRNGIVRTYGVNICRRLRNISRMHQMANYVNDSSPFRGDSIVIPDINDQHRDQLLQIPVAEDADINLTLFIPSPVPVGLLMVSTQSKATTMDYHGCKDVVHLEKMSSTNKDYQNLKLSDLKEVTTLGSGSFGRVELVTADTGRSFALKKIKKSRIVTISEQQNVTSEIQILREANSEFIVNFYNTFEDEKYIYILMEACLGGDLNSLLNNYEQLEEDLSQFYIGCVVEAFDYLHSRDIVHRDLKPGNLLIDHTGYIKMADFGFSKKLHGRKTRTFCGTSFYMAPELLLREDYDKSVDYWSLGVVMFEMLTGTSPFYGGNVNEVYENINRGIDSVQFTRIISRNARDLIKKLCRTCPAKRLKNPVELKKHKWFEIFDWEGLHNRTLKPSYVPRVRNAVDTSNFDKYSCQISNF